jgi:hypothetical protein
MARKAFFCYEQTTHGIWSPVVHYDEIIDPMSKETKPSRTVPILIERTYMGDSEIAVSFATLQALYPLDADKALQNESIRSRLNQFRRKPVVRPVEGFQTSQGEFFDTENKANLYENGFILRMAFAGMIKGAMPELATDAVEGAVTAILEEIKANHETVTRYCDAVAMLNEDADAAAKARADGEGASEPDRVSDSGEEADEVDGHAAAHLTEDGASIRSASGSRVDGEATTEAEPERSGKVVEPAPVRPNGNAGKRRKT